jgi:hypothetical protein
VRIRKNAVEVGQVKRWVRTAYTLVFDSIPGAVKTLHCEEAARI